MTAEVRKSGSIKIEDESEGFISFKNSENSFIDMFTTPHNERKQESNASRRRKYFNDESAIGPFHPFAEQPPKFYIEEHAKNVGPNSSTPISKNPSTSFTSTPLAKINTITGMYPSLRIEESNEDVIFIPEKETRANETAELFAFTMEDSTHTPLIMDVDAFETLKTSPKTPTHFPNYLRSTLSSANKAINASISFQTAEGSPVCHCPKLKNPRNPNITKPFNGIPAVKKLGFVDSLARKNIDQTRNNRNIEELLPIDDNVVFVTEKIKRKPKLRHDFLILLTRDIKKSEKNHRPVRSRVMPLRPWLGEHAFYSIDEKGLRTLEKTVCPQLKDRKLLRYISKHENSV